MRIDSHHHLWRYEPNQYAWIEENMEVLRRDYLPEDLSRLMRDSDVRGTVVVQARQSIEETQSLLQIASSSEFIHGVVGWAPICDANFPEILESLNEDSRLKGLRHVVQDESKGFLKRTDFNRGVAALLPTGLTYDLLIYAHQIKEAIEFVDRHPHQKFVLDHIGKPDVAAGAFGPWRIDILELAKRGNIVCKVSGMLTQARHAEHHSDILRPYFDTVLDAFGPSRLMVGSDWPVMTLACSYAEWWNIVAQWLQPLSASERGWIEEGVAVQAYGLPANTSGEIS